MSAQIPNKVGLIIIQVHGDWYNKNVNSHVIGIASSNSPLIIWGATTIYTQHLHREFANNLQLELLVPIGHFGG